MLFEDRDYELFVSAFPDLNIRSGTVGHSVTPEMSQRSQTTVVICLSFSSCFPALNCTTDVGSIEMSMTDLS